MNWFWSVPIPTPTNVTPAKETSLHSTVANPTSTDRLERPACFRIKKNLSGLLQDIQVVNRTPVHHRVVITEGSFQASSIHGDLSEVMLA